MSTPLHDPDARGFASDNYAGVHPEVLQAIVSANGGHQVSYGDDAYTARLQEVVREHFGGRAAAYPVFNGTGANLVSLQSMLRRWEAVVCAASAHINTDEGGAPEVMAGIKLLPVETPDGRLTPELVDTQAHGFGDEHHPQPAVVSITQSTELGTAYSVQQIQAVADHAHRLGMAVHLDGARLSNAAATLDLPLRAMTTDAGVDIVSLGGTKNGMLLGECVVVLDPERASGLRYLRKTSMQLASKMRFVSAQLIALYGGDLWLRNARHANAMAALLAESAGRVEGVRLSDRPVEANAVFAFLPPKVTAALQARYPFYVWDERTGEVRWMTTFDTTEQDVDAFVSALREELS